MILLAKIDLLDKFVLNYGGQIIAPQKVIEEACGKEREETPSITQLVKDKRTSVFKVQNPKLTRKLMEDFSIGQGESEALVVALQEKASLVATDDRNAMRACKMLKMKFTTAIAVVIRAFEKNLIKKDEALTKLLKLESVGRYSQKIIEDARKQIEGRV
ncbi:MAG: hypothetical protein HY730_01705 [Candidatus Tectomicrobia bacterium]|uniref:DUF3368 domain-containing protein n=1 Tax=Tectimicrobiota bacterium TaxID=2528274 RepID=A0A933GKG3_UNCTE|nr:hypothetical protein [Candidatus Tectomicrobia bacterium]